MRAWTFLLLLAAALGVDARTLRPVTDVAVSLEGDVCRAAPRIVSVVINDSDTAHDATEKDGKDGHRWIWHIGTPPLPVDLDTVRAYVRFDDHRTRYERPEPYHDRTLTFKFSDCSEKLMNLKVQAINEDDDNMNVSYRRGVDKSSSADNLIPGKNTIFSVWFAVETLNLQLARNSDAEGHPGLLISSPKRKEQPMFIMSEPPNDHPIPNPRVWSHSVEKGLELKEILDAMDVQKLPTDPRWTGYSRSTEEGELKRARLKTLFLTLK